MRQIQDKQYMFVSEPKHNPKGTPRRELGNGGLDPREFPRTISWNNSSENSSDNTTKDPSQVTIIKPPIAPSKTPTNDSTHVPM